MFCAYPELIASRLFCPAMKPDEAILIIGAEQFSVPKGYGNSLEYGGPFFKSLDLCDDGALASYIVAIDAHDYRKEDEESQYKKESIARDLGKAWAGFNVPDAPMAVATGNLGCGIFEGDAELKSIIQWMAACRAGKVLHYFPWNSRRIHAHLPRLASLLLGSDVTVGELATFLFNHLEARRVYAQLEGHSYRS